MNTNNNTIDNESLEDAAHNNFTFGSEEPTGSRSRSLYENKKESFIDGAKWQKEKDKVIIDKLVKCLENSKSELYRMKMSEALNWASGLSKAQEFAKEQIKEIDDLLQSIKQS